MVLSLMSGLGGLILFLVGLTLALGGVGLVLYGARMTREAVSKRVDLVRDRNSVSRAQASPAEMNFIRGQTYGQSASEYREAVRMFGAFGVRGALVSKALLTSRLVAVVLLGLSGFFALGHYALFAAAPPQHFAISIVIGMVGWFIPGLLISRQVTRRASAVVAGLPDALELLVICAEAGLSFEDGLDRIVGEMRKSAPELAEELALTSADLKILPNRDVALANFARRVPMPSVQTVTTTLSQTMRYGTPLGQALRRVGSELRTDALTKLEERANKLPTLMTIPMMLFIMPTIFMIVGGPAALRLLDAFAH